MSASLTFLVLTDHLAHKESNPVYHLIPVLASHHTCKEVWVASRGNPQNEPFFSLRDRENIQAVRADQHFGFDPGGNIFLKNTRSINPMNVDAILMRLPRPVTDDFLQKLPAHIPEAIFINHPHGILETSNKQFLLNFPELSPPMSLCYSISDILRFGEQFPIVLKPLKEYGGRGIVKMANGKVWVGQEEVEADAFLKKQEPYIKKEGYLAMKFLKNVSEGDKRIIVVGDQIMGASLRLPKEGSWLCNVAQGGSSVPSSVTSEEKEMIAVLAPVLQSKGILMAGVDTLTDDDGTRILSEVNTLSVGGFKHLQQQTDFPVIDKTVQTIIAYVYHKR